MKSIRPFKKACNIGLGSLLIVVLCLSCKKSNSIPIEEVPVTTGPASFSLVKVDYSLREGDGIDSSLHQLKSYKLQNVSNSLVEQTYFEDFQGLNKESLFTWKTLPSDLPKDLKLSILDIPTPTQISGGYIDAVNSGWKMTDTLQQKPYNYLKPVDQVVKIPAKSAIQIDRSIKEYQGTVSFVATLKNEQTGALHQLNGKWKGTLYFSNYSIVLSEKSLK